MTKRGAIVLAGGSARRFQTQHQPWQDKALAEFEEKPLLVHVIQNLQSAVGEVAVSVNGKERENQYRKVLEKYGLNAKFVVDEKTSVVSGPVVAILSGLHALNVDYCLTVPVDMPFLKPQLADYLLDATEGSDVAVPMWPDGTVETLLMALKRQSGLEISETLCALGKSRADSIIRGASKLQLISPLQEIKMLDPKLISFVNINRQEDLTKLDTRSIQGLVKENISLASGELPISDLRLLRVGQTLLKAGKTSEAQATLVTCTKDFEAKSLNFWAGVSAEKLAEVAPNSSSAKNQEYLRAAKNYQSEAKKYAEKGCRLLAERALADRAWCESKVA